MHPDKKRTLRGSLLSLAVMVVFCILFFVKQINFRINYVHSAERMMTIGVGGYIGLLINLTVFSVAVALLCRFHRIQWPHLLVLLIDAISILVSVLHYFSLDELDFVSFVLVGLILIPFLGLLYCYGMYYVFKWIGKSDPLGDSVPDEYHDARKASPSPRFGEEGFDYDAFDRMIEQHAKRMHEDQKKK